MGGDVALDGLSLLSPEYAKEVRKTVLKDRFNKIKVNLKKDFEKWNLTEEEKESFISQVSDELVKTSPEMPISAPELFIDRVNREEKPIDFIKRVYAPWIGHGFTQPFLRRLDPKLYMALHNWLRANAMPADLPLPTKSEIVKTKIERAGEKGIRAARRLVRSADYHR